MKENGGNGNGKRAIKKKIGSKDEWEKIKMKCR